MNTENNETPNDLDILQLQPLNSNQYNTTNCILIRNIELINRYQATDEHMKAVDQKHSFTL